MDPRPIDPATWPALSALLDEALALPETERGTFVQSLAGERAAHRDTLQWLLAQARGVETADFLATLPKLASMAESGPLTELTAGESIGPYRLISELGTGGMGAVWLAERDDGALRRKVALKLPRLVWAKGLAERMARERDILATLEHPHIARLYDAGVDQHGRPYLALEYVEGQPIDVYAKDRKLTVRQRLELLLQVCEAVAFAHSRLVVHRDLKPANILVTAQGQVRLLDFGIAKLMEGDSAKETQLTQLAGRALTLDYASPEQIKGEPIGTASDVYSLGVVAYELLTAVRPYLLKRGSAAELEEAIATAEAPRASDAASDPAARKPLRGDLDAILNKVLKKNASERYTTIEAFAQDMRRHLNSEPVGAQPDSLGYRTAKFLRRYRLQASAAGLVLVSVVAASAVSIEQARVARQQAQRALAVQTFLTDIFRTNTDAQPDPLKARQTTARELLDIGARRIDEHLKGDPEGRAEVLGMLGEMYYDLGLDGRAADLYGQEAQALKQAYGQRDARVAAALSYYARQLDELGRDDEQQRALAEAGSILDALGDHDSFERAHWHNAMAVANTYRGQIAVDHAERAVAIQRKRDTTRKSLVAALTRLGIQRWRIEDHARAEAAFAESLQLLEQMPDPSVSAILTALLMTASTQEPRLLLDAAEASYRRALALTLQRNGAAHPDTLHTQAKFGLFLHRTGRPDEAWRVLNAARAIVAAGNSPPYPVRAVRASVAAALLAEARHAQAEPEVEQLVSALREVGGGRTRGLVLALLQQAEARMGLGHIDRAESSLAEARAVWRSLPAEAARSAAADLARTSARLALRQGRPAAALEALAASPAMAGDSQAWAPDHLRQAALRSAALSLQGDAEGARLAAQAAVDALWASGLRDRYGALEAEALLPLARALQALGRADEACVAAQRAIRLRAANLGETSPIVDEARRAVKGCHNDDPRAASRSPVALGAATTAGR